MTERKKLLIISSVGLLLGFGLCGMGAYGPGKSEEFGGTWSIFGFWVFVLSSLLLMITLVSYLVKWIKDTYFS